MSTSGRSAAWVRARTLANCLDGLARVLDGAHLGASAAYDIAEMARTADYHGGDAAEFEAATHRIRDIIGRLEDIQYRLADETTVARRNEDRAAKDL